MRLAGQIEAPASAPVTFFAKSDDGMRLWIDGEPVIDLWQNGGSNRTYATVEMQAGGSYDIRLEYYDNRGEANFRVEWQHGNSGQTPTPTERFTPEGNTLPATSLAQ